MYQYMKNKYIVNKSLHSMRDIQFINIDCLSVSKMSLSITLYSVGKSDLLEVERVCL
jgi:hypothetical protein